MASVYTFNPVSKGAVTIVSSTTTSNAACGGRSMSMVVSNLSSTAAEFVYVCFGDSTVTATAADYVLLAGQQVSLTKFQDYTHVAVLAASGTPSVHVCPGEGI